MNILLWILIGLGITYLLIFFWSILIMLGIGANTWDEEEHINDYQERMRKNAE